MNDLDDQHLADKFRSTRQQLGLTCRQMSELMGFTKENGDRRVRYIEAGGRKSNVTGSARNLLRYISQGLPLQSGVSFSLPKHVIADSIEDGCNWEMVIRLEFPRFIGIVVDQPIDGLDCSQIMNDEWLAVAMWIDEPIGRDKGAIMEEAIDALERYTQQSIDKAAAHDRELLAEWAEDGGPDFTPPNVANSR